MNHLIMFISLWLPLSAGAAGFVCPSPRLTVRESDANCVDNEAYAEAGVLCLRKLEGLVETQTKKTRAALQKNNQPGNNAQAGALAGAGQDYGLSVAALDGLLKSARAARVQAETLKQKLFWPDDWDIAEQTMGSFPQFLDENPCFADNRDVLDSVVGDIDQIIRDLENAKKVSGQLKAGSGKSEQSLGQRPGAVAPLKSGGVAPAPAVKGKAWQPSDISGTEEKKKK